MASSSVCVPNYDHRNGRWQTAAAGMGEVRGGGRWQPPMVVDSVSCRQFYLRSAYTFSKKESVPEKTKKCFGMVRKTVAACSSRREKELEICGDGEGVSPEKEISSCGEEVIWFRCRYTLSDGVDLHPV